MSQDIPAPNLATAIARARSEVRLLEQAESIAVKLAQETHTRRVRLTQKVRDAQDGLRVLEQAQEYLSKKNSLKQEGEDHE